AVVVTAGLSLGVVAHGEAPAAAGAGGQVGEVPEAAELCEERGADLGAGDELVVGDHCGDDVGLAEEPVVADVGADEDLAVLLVDDDHSALLEALEPAAALGFGGVGREFGPDGGPVGDDAAAAHLAQTPPKP